MRILSHVIALSALSAAAVAIPLAERATVTLGIDVSSFQSPVDWTLAHSQGVVFAYFKATEGTRTLARALDTCCIVSIDRLTGPHARL
jgi:GH25 family lysozyme M1 (1,4-beta-N-acetylmuramidase)